MKTIIMITLWLLCAATSSIAGTTVTGDLTVSGGGTFNLNGSSLTTLNGLLRDRGPWASGGPYSVGDVVQNNGSSYVCTTANTDTIIPTSNWSALALQGLQGIQGEKGDTGSSLFKTTSFIFKPVGPNTANTQLTSLTFTPPQSGTVIARGRGYCNVYGNPSLYENVTIGIDTSVNAFTGEPGNWGLASTTATNSGSSQQVAWSAERTFSVAGGVATTLYMAGAKGYISSAVHNCSGTFTVELFTGSLP